jgi:amidase
MQYFGQEIFELANSMATGPDDPQSEFDGLSYHQALEINRESGVLGIDLAIETYDLDAVIAPTDNPAWSTDLLYGDDFVFGSSGLAAGAGYPIVQVPANMVHGLPLGLSFMGTAFSEPMLIRLASGFEAVTQVRRKNPPSFALSLPEGLEDGALPRKPRAMKPRPPPQKSWRPRRM